MQQETIIEGEIISEEVGEGIGETKEILKDNGVSLKLEMFFVTSPWCGPCRIQKPIIEELQKDYEITIKDVSIEENMQWAAENKIMQTPTLLIRTHVPQGDLPDGYIEKMFVGNVPKDVIIKYLEHGN